LFLNGSRLGVGSQAVTLLSFAALVLPVHGAIVTLTWDPNTEPDIAGYKFYYGVQSRIYTNVADVGNLITNTVSGLTEGMTYYFAVTAYNTAGVESDFSNEVNYTPTAPTNLVNQPPTIDSLADVILNEDAGLRTVTVTGISSGATNEVQTLTLTAVSDNPILVPAPIVIYTSPNASGILSFAPLPNANGTARISVTVDDGSATNNLAAAGFTVTANPVNDTPTLDAISDQVVSADSAARVIPLTGISSGAANEAQVLVLTAISDNPALIPNPMIAYTSPASTGTLTFAPSTNSNGSANITVTVKDGGSPNNPGENSTSVRAFRVTVDSVNLPPIISAIPALTIQKNQSTVAIPLTIFDPETPAQDLVLSGSSSSTNLVPTSQIVFGGSGPNRTVTVTPARGKIGTTFITIRVSDGSLQASTTFLLTVLGSGSGVLSAGRGGTEPPAITSITVDAVAGTTIVWASNAGARYRVQSKDNLEEATWRDLSGNIVAEDQVTSWIDGTAQGKSSRFYFISVP
jgi:hypothetical protein